MGDRGTSNKNQTGSSADRRARRAWLLQTFGDGVKAPCYRCGAMLDDDSITVDRILAGMDGGRYVRGNIRPACSHCNIVTGLRLMHHRKEFPYRCLVRFKTDGSVGLWRITEGEGEEYLTVQSVFTSRRLRNVRRSRIQAVPLTPCITSKVISEIVR